MNDNYTHTVFCKTSQQPRKDFTSFDEARIYANRLLSSGHKAVIRPYKPSKRPVDYAAERLEREGRL